MFRLFLFLQLLAACVGAAPLWIAVGYQGRRLVSADAEHWREIPSASPGPLRAIACDGTRFLAAGGDATASLALSTTDGEHWREWSAGPGEIATVTRGEGRFVALRGGRLLTAANGEERFTEGEALPWAGEIHPRQSASGDSEAGYRHVFLGELETPAGPVPWRAVTGDGGRWDRALRETPPARALVHGAGLFVAAGPGSLLETSHDGEIWTRRNLAAPDDLETLLWTGTCFLAQGKHLHSSFDGFTWRLEPEPPPGHLLWAAEPQPMLALSWSQVLLRGSSRGWKTISVPAGPVITAIAARH